MTWTRVRLALLLTLAPGIAAAQTVTANEPQDFPIERFQLSVDREGLLGLDWAGVPDHLMWDVGLVVNYADDLLVLRDSNGDRLGTLVDERLTGHIVGALALFDWIQLGVEIPIILHQSRGDSANVVIGSLPSLSGVGLGSIRIQPKIRLLPLDTFHIALVPQVELPSASRQSYLGENGAAFVPGLLVGVQFGGFRAGAQLAFRVRKNTSFVGVDVEDELQLKLGAALDLSESTDAPLELGLTLQNASPVSEPFSASNLNHVEMLGAVTVDLGGVSVFVGSGGGLDTGYGTPDFRIVGGIRFSQRTSDADDDGIPDEEDNCPNVAEDLDGLGDDDGCPEDDYDKDDVPDDKDLEPTIPEDKDGFEDGDGKPDPDNDKDGVLDADDRCPLLAGPVENQGCPDTDGDGVLDPDDKCPKQPGTKESEGCPDTDSDGDGIVDRLDSCAQVAEDKDGFEDSDGCPDLDNDGDGVVDAKDRCPNEVGPIENRGCPDTDRDNDKVVDRLDNCPDEPGTVENHGCQAKQLVQIKEGKLEILEKVFFETGRAKIKSRSHALLMNVVRVIRAHSEIGKIQVEGHTDSTGSDRTNQRLSDARAAKVRQFLIDNGVPAERLVSRGFGESRPIDTNKTAEGRSRNRRVEFNVVEDEQK